MIRESSSRLFEVFLEFSSKTPKVEADFGEGHATKQSSVKKSLFLLKEERHSVNEGFGKEFYSIGSSGRRAEPASESQDFEN